MLSCDTKKNSPWIGWGLLLVLRGLLEICERESVKKSQRRRVNVVSHVDWFFLLLGSEERECVLCHVGWFVLLLASGEAKREKDRTSLSCSIGLHGRGWKTVTLPFYSCPGKSPGQNGMEYSHWSKIRIRDQTVKIFLRQKIIWNYFCYNFTQAKNCLSSVFQNKNLPCLIEVSLFLKQKTCWPQF